MTEDIKIFKNEECSEKYIKIFSKDNKCVKLIVLSQDILTNISELETDKNNLKNFQEITLIIDFPHLAEKLKIETLYKLLGHLNKSLDNNGNTKLSLIIKNCYIDETDTKDLASKLEDKIILNKLEIDDELYSISSINLDSLFQNLEVNELILKRFKFNSKTQLENFYKFIIRVECKKLTLDDIFVELIIRKDEKDSEYKYLDKYIALLDEVITLDNNYSDINSLTLRDCPLFAIIGNIFNESSSNKYIDIDENSLINPSIITKFKIFNGLYDICFDLDSYKIKLESSDSKVDYDGVDYLIFIFKIIASFQTENEKIQINKDDDDGLEEIDRKNFHKLTFRNFDITKLGYITNDHLTYIEEKDWVLLDKEEKERKEKWEKLERDLENFVSDEDLSNVKELTFDNCSNFFIKWVIQLIHKKGQANNENQNDFDLLKIKKCGKEYVNLYEILQLKINKLVLFDTPLIIGDHFSETLNLSFIENTKLGTVENLTIKINSLDSYGIQYNLNTYKTLEILVEIITSPNFNKNITFELGALSNIMTYLACQKYVEAQNLYYNPNEEENGDNNVKSNIENYKTIKSEEIINKNPKILPKKLYFSGKKYRDFLCYESFNISYLKGKIITIKNATIKKQTENFENLNYLKIIDEKKENNENKNKNETKNNELKKIDFGSDGFYIERDFKLFFSENEIETVILNNINFSSCKDNIKKIETETIINLLSDEEYEKKNIEENEYKKTSFPNYKIDVKTLNGILFNNFLFEDFGIMLKYYSHRIRINEKPENDFKDTSENIERKVSMNHYFNTFKKIFQCFIDNDIGLTVIINNLKELKDFYMIFSFYKQLVEGKSVKEDNLKYEGRLETVQLPSQEEIKDKFNKFFIMEKDENGEDKYSKINYYYFTKEEEDMIKDKKIKINVDNKELIFKLDLKIDDLYTAID